MGSESVGVDCGVAGNEWTTNGDGYGVGGSGW